MQYFRLSVNFAIQPPTIIPQDEAEVPAKLKSESPIKKSQKYKLMVKNARRSTAGNLVKGYTKMPKDGAIFQPLTNSFKPTIIVNSVASSADLEENQLPEDRMNGFMVKCYG